MSDMIDLRLNKVVGGWRVKAKNDWWESILCHDGTTASHVTLCRAEASDLYSVPR